MKSVSDNAVEKIKTYFIYHNFFLNHAIYETMWKNTLQPGRSLMTIWGMLISCWMRKSIITVSENVTLAAFRLQKCLQERASTLRFMYTACFLFRQIKEQHLDIS